MSKRGYLVLVPAGLGIALLVALFSPLASSEPDGLERVAEDKAFLDKGKDAPYEAIADYAFPWVENEDVATILAGVVGVLLVAAFVFLLGFTFTALSRRAAARVSGDGSLSPPGSDRGFVGREES